MYDVAIINVKLFLTLLRRSILTIITASSEILSINKSVSKSTAKTLLVIALAPQNTQVNFQVTALEKYSTGHLMYSSFIFSAA